MHNDNPLRLAHRMLLSSSLETFTTRMFQYINKTPYILGEHHKKICSVLDKVIAGESGYNKVIINIAPRYGKTLLVSQMFIAYGFAINPESKFLHLSYSGSLTQDNSIAVKDIITSEYFQAVFDTRIRVGSNTKSKWDTEQGGGEYATSTLGQITGFGAGQTDKEEDAEIDAYTARFNANKFSGAIVIDDPIKPEDALSDNARETVNRRFETTIRNRVNSRRTPIVIIMQRLHEHDLCGYLQEVEPGQWTVLSLPCLYTDELGQEHALWDFKHSVDELHKLRAINPFVFETQYMQNPKPLEGLMYEKLRTYDTLPIVSKFKQIRKNYTDTADTGSDWLCSVCYIEYEFGMYIVDVLYTKKPMEYTETETAKMLCANNVELVNIESNNGGRGFARNVEQNVRTLGNLQMRFETFTQGANKQVRIFSHSAEVQNMIYFPSDWEVRWREFASDVKGYRKEGRNAHDDCVDALTGMVEYFQKHVVVVTDEEIEADFQ